MPEGGGIAESLRGSVVQRRLYSVIVNHGVINRAWRFAGLDKTGKSRNRTSRDAEQVNDVSPSAADKSVDVEMTIAAEYEVKPDSACGAAGRDEIRPEDLRHVVSIHY